MRCEGWGGVKVGQRADELLEPRVILELVVARHLVRVRVRVRVKGQG